MIFVVSKNASKVAIKSLISSLKLVRLGRDISIDFFMKRRCNIYTAEVIPYQEHWNSTIKVESYRIMWLLLLFRPQNMLGTIFLRLQLNFAVILVHSACMSHALTKLCFQKCQDVCRLNFYFAPITCCLACFHAHTYYHALLILLYNSFVDSRQPMVSTSVL